MRCVLPNSEKQPGVFNAEFILPQLNSSSLFAYQQLMSTGYPFRFNSGKFLTAYKSCSDSFNHLDKVKFIQIMMCAVGFKEDQFKIGNDTIFLRNVSRSLIDRLFNPAHLEANIEQFRNYYVNNIMIAPNNQNPDMQDQQEEYETLEIVARDDHNDQIAVIQNQPEGLEIIEFNEVEVIDVPVSLEPPAHRSKRQTKTRPSEEIRYDQLGHWPEIVVDNKRCKLENCQFKSRHYCLKCKVNLCLNNQRNCFKQFHVLP